MPWCVLSVFIGMRVNNDQTFNGMNMVKEGYTAKEFKEQEQEEPLDNIVKVLFQPGSESLNKVLPNIILFLI